MSNPYFVPSVSLGPDGGSLGQTFLLICPFCGDRNTKTSSPSADGASYSMPVLGDCGHKWNIILRIARGQTFLLADMEL